MLEKRFNFIDIERKISEDWKKKKIFNFKLSEKENPYTIIMPPPNVTGSLHMGHALTFTLQDILIRFNKKLGRNVLWQPGIDHAGIATEMVVERKLILDEKKTKRDIGRNKFLEKIWRWKSLSGDKIVNQLKRLGTAVDWSISKFTLDDSCSVAVKEAFLRLYNSGFIYQDERLVNWDPELQTAVSDLEVNQKEIYGNLWYIKYEIHNSNDFLIVATTRPETMFGDSAIAIHPKNKKLNFLIGKKVVIPLTNKIIPIISDEYADPKKGSGAVKITPAHDFNDFLVGKKHKIPIINILDKEAKLNKNVPSKLIGLDRYHARKKIIIMLKEKKQLEKIVKNKMVVPVGDRSGSVIEPLLTKQWFLDSKKLSKKIQSSIKKKEICFHPKSWMNTFKYWIDNIEPWCISRQIWWGHRIPIWYTDNGKKIAATDLKDAEAFIKKNNLKCKITHQDSDVLDTWFSSALWPFSTLGWPDNSKKLKKHFPSDVLVTGFDIIFFWVARMIMMSLHFKKKIPFKNIYIHPLVRDEKGEKMSKSKGNVIDPLEIVNLYGADSLRFTLANLSTQGRDIKLSNKLIENSRNFITKIWNVARFAEFNNFSFDNNYSFSSNKLALNNWIVFRLYQTQQKILKYLKEYKFNLLLNELYHFVWNDFCDLYLEFSKIYIKTEDNVKEISNNFSSVFKIILNLLNPIIPFVTEEISKKLNYTDSTLYDELLENEIFVKNFKSKKINDFENVIKLIKLIRADFRNRKKNKSSLIIFSKIKVCWIDEYEKILLSILSLDKIIYSTYKKGSKFFIIANTKLSIVESGNNIIDETDIKQKIKFYKNEIQFFEKKLQNKNFIEKAPKKIVNENKFKLLEAKKNLKLLTN